MIIAISGTPGTGKTSISEHLEHNSIGITEFAEKNDIGEIVNGEREIDVDNLVEELEEEIKKYDNVVVEGHMAHNLSADYCIILRCRPDILRDRLSKRSYPEQKVEENIEAEAMALILSEAVSMQDNIIEIDTTEKSPEELADEIKERIEKDETGFGDIDWTEYL